MPGQKLLFLESVAAPGLGIREPLVRLGHQVALSRYEAEGLRRIREWQPDAIFLSIDHPGGSLIGYCGELRTLAPDARIVVTSPLARTAFFREHADLAPLVDEVLQRPFTVENVLAALGRDTPEEPPEAPARAKIVAVVDCEPATIGFLRETLQPFGAAVAYLTPEEIGSFCRARRPAALLLEWPLLDPRVAAALAGVREDPVAAHLPVLLLSAATRATVAKAAPDLARVVDLVFGKPVPWDALLRVLARYLDLPALSEFRPAPPSAAISTGAPPPSEEGTLARLQERLEAKFLEVEELKAELAEVRSEIVQEELGRARTTAEGQRKAELALAMERLERSELEEKLEALQRQKVEPERGMQEELERRAREIEHWRHQAAEADLVIADLAAKVANLEEALARKGPEGVDEAARRRP